MMTDRMTTSQAWHALEDLADLERQRDEAEAEVDRLTERIGVEYRRIADGSGHELSTIKETLSMIRAVGSPLDIDNPREPAAKRDPLEIPAMLDRRREAAAE